MRLPTLLLLVASLIACENTTGNDDDTGGGGERDDTNTDTDVVDTDTDTDVVDTDTDTDVVDTDTDTDVVDTDTDVVDTTADAVLIDLTDASALTLPTDPDFSHDPIAGTAAVPPKVTLEPAAASSATDPWLVATDPAIQTAPAGEYAYTDVIFDGRAAVATDPGALVDVDGDLTLNISGDLRLGWGAQIRTTGALVLRVAGDLEIQDASLVGGSVTIHHTGPNPMVLGNNGGTGGTFVRSADHRAASLGGPEIHDTGDVLIYSRAGVVIEDETYVYTGDPEGLATDTSGEMQIRTDGDVSIGTNCYVYTGDARLGTVGEGWLYAAGSYSLADDGWHFGDNGEAGGGHWTIHAATGFSTGFNSHLRMADGGRLDIRTDGPMHIGGECGGGDYRVSTANPSNPLTLRAASLTVDGYGYIAGGASDVGKGGDALLDVAGDITFDGGADGWAGVQGGSARCFDGGDLVLRGGGDLTVGYGNVSPGPSRQNFTLSCSATDPGALDVKVAGTVTEDLTNGSGVESNGTTDIVEQGQPVDVAPVDHAVWTWHDLVLAPQTERIALVSADITNPTGEARLEIRQPGADWVDASTLVGTPLADGWQARLRLKQRQFDGASAEGFSLTFQ